jgi:hypothetical protein
MKNEVLFPLQVTPPPIYCDEAVSVPELIVVPELEAVNGAIAPAPLRPMPIVLLELAQA